jgi:hypothetical protein
MNKIYFAFYNLKDGPEKVGYVFPCYGVQLCGLCYRVRDEFEEWHFLNVGYEGEILYRGILFSDIRITGEIINLNEEVLITLHEAVRG